MTTDYEQFKAKYGNLYDEELRLESIYKQQAADHLQITLNRYKAEGQSAETNIGRNLTTHRLGMLSQAYSEFIEDALKPKRGVKPTWVSTLLEIDQAFENRQDLCNMLSFGVLTTCINALTDKGTKSYVVSLGRFLMPYIIAEYEYHLFMKHLIENDLDKEKKIFESGLDKRVSAYYRRHYMSVSMSKDNYKPPQLSKAEVTMLAMQLIYVAEDVLGYFTIEKVSEKGMPQIMPTQAYIDGWKRNEQHLLDNSYRLVPTIIPPMEWTDYYHGGYYGDLAPKNRLLRLDGTRVTTFHKKYLKILNQSDLSNVLKAINGIQATAWTINKQVLEVINEIVRQGGNIAGLPNFNGDPKPELKVENPTEEQIAKLKKERQAWYKGDTRRKSLVLRALSHIKIANDFAKYDKIYFPCNMDFRGRVYPIPSFNFQGDDLNKALILFAEPPAFDSVEDKDWMAITGANLAGHDKISFADRIKWVLENEQNILSSAKDPLGFRWWADQDEPCQMLSFCFEWAKLKQYETEHDGSCIGFVTGLPSHQDGTCSGLQHFSAILRDPVGGVAVNLVPQDKPNDIYSLVAVEVNKILKVDAVNGTPDETDDEGKLHYGTKSMAQLWLNFGVNRKVCKRPTMTLAYGAKEYGYRDQILDDTIEPAIRDQKAACVFNDKNKWRASAYLANLIWNSIGTVVVKAVEGMQWLQDCARKVTKTGKPVTWVNPLGLPIQQNYLAVEYSIVRMTVAGKRVRVYFPEETGNINKVKQANGIAPNFIHSMDACHLMLAINYCIDAGIKHFATIHDSYGCPMAQTKLMYKMVRQAFVDMYTQNDVLKDFKASMQLSLRGTKEILPDPPSKGELDLSCVLDSNYVFC